MTSSDQPSHGPLSATGLRNARWLPNARSADSSGGRGAVLRCAQFEDAAACGIRWIQQLRPALILDLRSDYEISEPPPLAQHPGYRHRPFIDAARDHERQPDTEHTRADLYRGSLDRNGAAIAAALQEILSAPEGPIIVHCKSGVDRTGLLAMLMLDTVGVDRELITADYATFTPAPGEQGPPSDPPRPETVTATYDHLDTNYGGARGYLSALDLPADVAERLSARLLSF